MTPLKPVTGSAQIGAYGYDPATRVFAVVFHGSGAYYFQEVPPATAEAFDLAESKGKAFHSLIKGRFEFTRSDPSAQPTEQT